VSKASSSNSCTVGACDPCVASVSAEGVDGALDLSLVLAVGLVAFTVGGGFLGAVASGSFISHDVGALFGPWEVGVSTTLPFRVFEFIAFAARDVFVFPFLRGLGVRSTIIVGWSIRHLLPQQSKTGGFFPGIIRAVFFVCADLFFLDLLLVLLLGFDLVTLGVFVSGFGLFASLAFMRRERLACGAAGTLAFGPVVSVAVGVAFLGAADTVVFACLGLAVTVRSF
jgi:hypothetical protein